MPGEPISSGEVEARFYVVGGAATRQRPGQTDVISIAVTCTARSAEEAVGLASGELWASGRFTGYSIGPLHARDVSDEARRYTALHPPEVQGEGPAGG